MIDLEAIRARVRFWDDCSEVVMTQAEIDAKALLAYVDELPAERALIVARAENAEAALAYAASTGDECAVEVEALRSRLADVRKEHAEALDGLRETQARLATEQRVTTVIEDRLKQVQARLAEVTKLDSIALCNALAKVHELEAERALLVTRAENAEAALAYAASTGDECAIEVEALRKRLAALETPK